MLDRTMATAFEPGSNVKGDVTGANWAFLLPGLEIGRLLLIGDLAPRAVLALARRSRTMRIVGHDGGARAALAELCRDRGLTHVDWLTGAGERLPIEDGWADLVAIGAGRPATSWRREAARRAEIERVLAPDGHLYFELGREANKALAHWRGAQHYALTPAIGETQTAVPAEDRATARYLIAHGHHGRSVRGRGLKTLRRRLDRVLATSRLTRRTGVLWSPAAAGPGPPAYLCATASAAGIDLAAYRWGFAATGEYSSRKLLFFLFAPDDDDGVPRHVVKLVRDAAHSPRLENEIEALRALEARGLAADGALPRITFAGHHAGLALAGESVIDGRPLRQCTRGGADCPLGRAAVEWLTGLGMTTAVPTDDAGEYVRPLEQLLERFVTIYGSGDAEQRFLRRQLERLRHAGTRLPRVFQHGDPGMWNVLVDRRERPVFLDWEAAEAHGLPLWDLFYFLRSFAVWTARRRRVRDGLRAVTGELLGETDMAAWLIEVTRDYCERVGVPAAAVEPLFYTCWMHRALKEATRLVPADLGRGHYVRLLRACVEGRERPALYRLFAPGRETAGRTAS